MTEKQTHLMVCQYIRSQYKDIRFHSDYGSGIKLTMGQATVQKHQQSHKGFPDLFIIKPRGNYAGLFIELKRDGEKIFKKDGVTPRTDHLANQIAYLNYLNANGFYADFAIGFDKAKELIDWYMKLERQDEVVDYLSDVATISKAAKASMEKRNKLIGRNTEPKDSFIF